MLRHLTPDRVTKVIRPGFGEYATFSLEVALVLFAATVCFKLLSKPGTNNKK